MTRRTLFSLALAGVLAAALPAPQAVQGPWNTDFFGADQNGDRAGRDAVLSSYLDPYYGRRHQFQDPYGYDYAYDPYASGQYPQGTFFGPDGQAYGPDGTPLYPPGEADAAPGAAEPQFEAPEPEPEVERMPSPSELAFGPQGKDAQIDKAKAEHTGAGEAMYAGDEDGAEAEREEGEEEEEEDEGTVHHHVNVGGVQRGTGGEGPTNFHVYSDEKGEKRYSDELDPESEEYIREKMLPKLANGGQRKNRSSGPVWDVFGD